MKKLLVIIISLLLFPSIACAAVKRDASTIASSYCAWSSAFGATDISWEDNIQNDPEDESKKYLYIDDLIIKFDFSEYRFDVEWVLFQCNAHGGTADPENKPRKLGFFAALEYGMPTTFSQSEIDEAYSVAESAYDDYYDVMGRNMMKLFNGEPVLLRENEYGTYFLFYNEQAGFCISVE